MGSTTRAGMLTTCLVAVATWGFVQPAAAQSPVVALRTSASIVRPGDCLRLEALALDDVAGPMSTQVTYRFDATVMLKDEHGKETTSTRSAEVRRQPGPVLDTLNRLQLHLLDDTFCFGQGGTPGPYNVEVALRSAASGSPFATLKTCVMFEDPDAPASAGRPGCAFLLRGLTRAEGDSYLVFDADLPAGGFYRGAILRGGTVEAVLDAGIAQAGAHELTVVTPPLNRTPGETVDLVLVEQSGQVSSTVPRLHLAPVR